MSVEALITFLFVTAGIKYLEAIGDATFCKSQFTEIQIPNPHVPLKGKIYSPSFPLPHRNHRRCLIKFTGLMNSTWIKFRQVKLSPYKGECLRRDFNINTYVRETAIPAWNSTKFATAQCDTLEGTYSSDQIDLTLMTNSEQASPFYIEYESECQQNIIGSVYQQDENLQQI